MRAVVVVLMMTVGCRGTAPPPPAPASEDATPVATASSSPEAVVVADAAAEETPLPSRARLLAPARGTAVRGFVAMSGGAGAHVVYAVPGPEEAAAEQPVLVASLTKMWVAVAVLRLAARKELSLDDEVRALLPALAKKAWADSTVRELLHHVSRVPEFDDRDGFYSKSDIDFTDPAPVLAKHIGAGTEKRGVWKYRNSEFALLGAILQERRAKPVASVLEEEVFAPATMRHAGVLVRGKPAGLDLGPMGRVRPHNFFTAGNGYASASDLLAFFDALDAGTLLDEPSRALLFEADAKNNHAAAGCWAFPFAGAEAGPTLLVERPGSFGNVRLETLYFPALHRAIVLWSQAPVDLGRPRTNGSIAAALARAALE
ncbi:MAG: beta-lactamase family protein [Labilithrix sp.]|nr:beta-lactamase family protein [Labilithrix sp.]